MNNTNSTISINNLDAIIKAKFDEKQKIQTALDAAKKALENAKLMNKARKEIVSQQVSALQKELASHIAQELEIQKKTYNDTMAELGLSSEKFPIQDALAAADEKVLTPALASVGKVAKVGMNIFGAMKDRVVAGFKS
jgi:hypothetical protein